MIHNGTNFTYYANGLRETKESNGITKTYYYDANGRLANEEWSNMLHDAGWMFDKLRSGYTVIDIGMTTLHRGRGLYYGAERFVIGLWKTRNLWKLPINYYF